jgi:phosphatidylglycerophosphate synthase
MPLIPRFVEAASDTVLTKVARLPLFTRVSPNTVSTLGVVMGLASAILFSMGDFITAGVLLAVSGFLDLLDGKIARAVGRTSVFGAVYDSTLDRATELAVYASIGAYFINRNMHWTSLVVVIAAGGSWLVSYARARAESYGVKCHVGLLRRGERIVLLAGGGILSFVPQPFHDLVLWFLNLFKLDIRYAYPPMPLTMVIFLIAGLSQVTLVQRLAHVWKSTHSTSN